jgi:hypothetical protein
MDRSGNCRDSASFSLFDRISVPTGKRLEGAVVPSDVAWMWRSEIVTLHDPQPSL